MPAWMTGGAPGAPSANAASERGGVEGQAGGITSVEDALKILEQFGKVGRRIRLLLRWQVAILLDGGALNCWNNLIG